jgi:hypothetical protein
MLGVEGEGDRRGQAAAAFSVMPATTGRNIAAALCCPQAPNRLRRSGDVPPLRHGPQGPGALVALRQTQGFMVVAHDARSLRAKPAPRVRRLCSLKGNPRARLRLAVAWRRRVPLAGRFKLAVSAPPLRDVAAILSFKRPAFTLPPIAVTEVAETTSAPAPTGTLRASTIADVDTAAAAGSGPEAGNRPCGPFATKTPLQDGAGRAIRTRPLS